MDGESKYLAPHNLQILEIKPMKKILILFSVLLLAAGIVYSQCSFHPYPPTVVASGDLTGLNAALPYTTIFTPSSDGEFLIITNLVYDVTTCSSYGTLLHVTWTDTFGHDVGPAGQWAGIVKSVCRRTVGISSASPGASRRAAASIWSTNCIAFESR